MPWCYCRGPPAHEPKLAGLARRFGEQVVSPQVSAAELNAVAVPAIRGQCPPLWIAAQEAPTGTRDLNRVRELARARPAPRSRPRRTLTPLPGYLGSRYFGDAS